MKKYDIDGNSVATWLIVVICAITLFIVFALSGCVTPKKIDKILLQYCKGENTTVRDSTSTIVTTVTTMDSTYYISLENIMNAYIECLNGKPVITKVDTIYKDKYINTNLNLNGNNLQIKTKVDSAEVVARWNEKHTTNTTVVNTDQKEKVVVTTNILTDTQKKWISMGKWSIVVYCFLILLVIVYFVFRYKSKILSLLKR